MKARIRIKNRSCAVYTLSDYPGNRARTREQLTGFDLSGKSFVQAEKGFAQGRIWKTLSRWENVRPLRSHVPLGDISTLCPSSDGSHQVDHDPTFLHPDRRSNEKKKAIFEPGAGASPGTLHD